MKNINTIISKIYRCTFTYWKSTSQVQDTINIICQNKKDAMTDAPKIISDVLGVEEEKIKIQSVKLIGNLKSDLPIEKNNIAM